MIEGRPALVHGTWNTGSAGGAQVRGRGRGSRWHQDRVDGRQGRYHLPAELAAKALRLHIVQCGYEHAQFDAGSDTRPIFVGPFAEILLVESGGLDVAHDALAGVSRRETVGQADFLDDIAPAAASFSIASSVRSRTSPVERS